MARKVVYLSGRIDALSYTEAAKKRERAREILVSAGWDVLDPLRGKESQKDKPQLDNAALAELKLSPRALIDRDLDDIKRANIVLYLTADDLSWGSMLEVGYASMVAGTPVVAVGSNPATHGPWASHFVAKFADTVEDACDFIINYFDRGYRLHDDIMSAYAAGFIDADGAIMVIHQTNGDIFTPTVSVANNHHTTLLVFKQAWGGAIEPHKSGYGGNTGYTWRCTGSAARELLRAVIPYLWQKREQALLVYSLADQAHARANRTRIPEEIEAQRIIYDEVRRLNQHTPRPGYADANITRRQHDAY